FTPPKSTLPMRIPCSRKVSITRPGMPRHTSAALLHHRCSHGQLSKAQAAVAGRDATVTIHCKALASQTPLHQCGQVRIQKYAAGQPNGRNAPCRTNSPAHVHRNSGEGDVKSAGNRAASTLAAIDEHAVDELACINRHRMSRIIDSKAVRRSGLCECGNSLELHGRLPFIG